MAGRDSLGGMAILFLASLHGRPRGSMGPRRRRVDVVSPSIFAYAMEQDGKERNIGSKYLGADQGRTR
ncbi:hypothetical protein PG985_016005 [Apiospora marii]|uniref:uncharacterized protein n=1 Tax=Apiospora marii TaxID=335849 RepID=UPI0031304992